MSPGNRTEQWWQGDQQPSGRGVRYRPVLGRACFTQACEYIYISYIYEYLLMIEYQITYTLLPNFKHLRGCREHFFLFTNI